MSLTTKNIWDTIRSLKAEGYLINEIEALLIHSDDLSLLLHDIATREGKSPDSYNAHELRSGIKLFGVKIIESQYVERGSIFKIFKDGPLSMYPTGPGFTGTVTMPEEFRLPTVVDEKKSKKYSSKRRIDLGG